GWRPGEDHGHRSTALRLLSSATALAGRAPLRPGRADRAVPLVPGRRLPPVGGDRRLGVGEAAPRDRTGPLAPRRARVARARETPPAAGLRRREGPHPARG